MEEGVGEQDVHQDPAALSWHDSILCSSMFLDDALLLTEQDLGQDWLSGLRCWMHFFTHSDGVH